MLQHFVRRRVKPLTLGIDWQVDKLRIVLLGCAKNTHETEQQRVLGQWHLSLRLSSVALSTSLKAHTAWQDFITQIVPLLGNASYMLVWAFLIGFAVGCTALQICLK